MLCRSVYNVFKVCVVLCFAIWWLTVILFFPAVVLCCLSVSSRRGGPTGQTNGASVSFTANACCYGFRASPGDWLTISETLVGHDTQVQPRVTGRVIEGRFRTGDPCPATNIETGSDDEPPPLSLGPEFQPDESTGYRPNRMVRRSRRSSGRRGRRFRGSR